MRRLVLDHILLLLLVLCPLRRLHPLRILPGSRIAKRTATLTLARAAKLLGQVLLGHLRQQLGLVTRAEHVDLVDGDGVEEALDDAEDAGEAPGRVDQVQLAEPLRVVVLRDGRGHLHVSVHRADARQPDAFEVHDAAARLEELAGFARAGGEAGVGELFVLGDEVLKHAILVGDLVHGVEVDFAELLNVDRATVLVS